MAVASVFPAINFLGVAGKSDALPKLAPHRHGLLWSSAAHYHNSPAISFPKSLTTREAAFGRSGCRLLAVSARTPPIPPSPADMIIDFYTAINDKDGKKLEYLISQDCTFEELAFPKPFYGRKEVMNFLSQLMDGMGKNVKFMVERVGEGGESSVGVMWHMEWKGKQLPFTRGCSFFECKVEETLVIKKGRIVVEMPIKPGEFVLKLLKTITSLFDQHPNISERFLLRPQAPLEWLLKMYKIFIRPLVWTLLFPIMAYYTHLWKFAITAFNNIFNILLKILKFFK